MLGLFLKGLGRSPAPATPGRVSLAIVLWTALVVTLWLIGAAFVVPPVIHSAYRGESWPILNDLISGSATLPVEAYLADWRGVAGRIATLILALGAAAVVVARPEVRDFVRPDGLPHGALPLGNRRRVGIIAVITTVVLGSLASIFLNREVWPFSQYGMYSGIAQERFSQIRVFGVTAAGEVDLSATRYWTPMGRVHFDLAVQRWQEDTEQVEAALSGALTLYDSRRLLGSHDGPAVRGLRFYEVEWLLHPRAENVDRPERRELIYEFLRESE